MRSVSAATCWCLTALWLTAARADEPAAPFESARPATEPGRPATEQVEFFERKIRPLLHARCGECHSNEKGAENGELFLQSASGIARGGTRGKAVIAGKPDESLLIRAVRYVDSDLQMPPEGKLAAAEIDLLVEWVRRGAALPADAANATSSTRVIDVAAGKAFWSFQPLKPTVPLPVIRGDWPGTRTDAFLLERIEAAGLTPSAEADRRTLIRRASLDLTGLPPTSDGVAEFLADERPDAYERLIDRLLASPQYGEREARLWLDLARYTDTAAFWEASTANAWLYRDWVVRAFNEDRPYDDFVRRQLAADLIPDSPPADLAALGFLGLSPNYWKELRLAPALIQTVVADEWDERIDAVSRTFLGLTVACARCHHHKFDPITTEDYYALAGVFASSQLAERPLLPAAQADTVRKARAQLAQWDAELKKKEKDSDEARELQDRIDELRRNTPDLDAPWAHVVDESSVFVVPDGDDKTRLDIRPNQPRDVPVFRRGSPANPGGIVPRRFLSVLSSGEPQRFTHGSGRGELAEAIFTDARPLAARVVVNRVWARHFGQGLVRTVSDFGSQGERPTHPELLDDLAQRFLDHGWSLKWLHRELVLSAAYRQGSTTTDLPPAANRAGSAPAFDLPPSSSVDPDNRLLARMFRRRLDVEAWRDAMLAATGRLDLRMGGPSQRLDDAANRRRTLYGTVGRYEQSTLLKLYDFPEPTAHSPNRVATTTPLQQLFVLNSPFLQESAAALAARANDLPDASPARRIEACYAWLFQRAPTPRELELSERFLADCAAASLPTADAWQLYAHSLLGLNELMFAD